MSTTPRPDGGPSSTAGVVLKASRVSKRFVNQLALDDVDFDVRASEVHALVGHNGSGKSTLVKILAGYHVPEGDTEVQVGGKRLTPGDPEASHAAGLRFIHQELGLVDDLTVLENLRLDGRYETGRGGRIKWRNERRRAADLLRQVQLDVHPDVPVSELRPVQRTQLAVARALEDEEAATVLFLDEPTAALPDSEVERLFALIKSTVRRGVGVVYISHRLEELPRIADRITVLREGRVVGHGSRVDFGRDRLVDLIVGADRASSRRAGSRRAEKAATGNSLSFEGIDAGELRDATFAVRSGEVLGMVGLAGSGVHDIVGVLLARVPLRGGMIRAGDQQVPDPGPGRLREHGIAALPSERALKSIQELTVRENLTLPQLDPLFKGLRLRRSLERDIAVRLIKQVDLRPADPEKPVVELSGGNQQKVAVAKWLHTSPRVLVLDEPTQGVDVGGKDEILQLLRSAANEGVGVLLCSSDLEELEVVCDRVLVIRDGGIRAELTGADITPERISEECYRDAA